MLRARAEAGSAVVDVPTGVEEILSAGLTVDGDRLVLKHFIGGSHVGEAQLDDVGFEAFVNHLHVDATSVADAVLRGIAALGALSELLLRDGDRPCRVILSIDDGVDHLKAEPMLEDVPPSAGLRFHAIREGQEWLLPDLESYREALMVVDVVPVRP